MGAAIAYRLAQQVGSEGRTQVDQRLYSMFVRTNERTDRQVDSVVVSTEVRYYLELRQTEGSLAMCNLSRTVQSFGVDAQRCDTIFRIVYCYEALSGAPARSDDYTVSTFRQHPGLCKLSTTDLRCRNPQTSGTQASLRKRRLRPGQRSADIIMVTNF